MCVVPGGTYGARSTFSEPACHHGRGGPFSHLGSHGNSGVRGFATDTHRDAGVDFRPRHLDVEALNVQGGLADTLRGAPTEDVADGPPGPGSDETSGDCEAFGTLG